MSRQHELRRQLRVVLNRHGGRLVECRSAEEMSRLALSERPDLILLDASGHDGAGADATRLVRAHSKLPLIVLVRANDERQKLAALDAGADDWMPLGSATEMLARIRTALERRQRPSAQTPPHGFQAGTLEVDFLAREVRLRGKPVHVTPTEYKLLLVLIESAGKVVTHEQLQREVWGPAASQRERRLRVHMNQLQRKLELTPPFAPYLIAERAVGYRLCVPA